MRRIFRRAAAAAATAACVLGLSVCSLASEAEPAGIVTEGEPVDEIMAQYVEQAAIQNLMLSQEELAVLSALYAGDSSQGVMLQTLLDNRLEMGAIESIDLEAASTVMLEDGTYLTSIPVVFANGEENYVVNMDTQGTLLEIEFTSGEAAAESAQEGEISSDSVMIIAGILVALIVVVLIGKSMGGKKGESHSSESEAPASTAAPAAAPSSDADEELAAVMAAAIAAAEDESELVAVISAAIAAYEGTSSNGLVVRSIRRLPGSRWKQNR